MWPPRMARKKAPVKAMPEKKRAKKSLLFFGGTGEISADASVSAGRVDSTGVGSEEFVEVVSVGVCSGGWAAAADCRLVRTMLCSRQPGEHSTRRSEDVVGRVERDVMVGRTFQVCSNNGANWRAAALVPKDGFEVGRLPCLLQIAGFFEILT